MPNETDKLERLIDERKALDLEKARAEFKIKQKSTEIRDELVRLGIDKHLYNGYNAQLIQNHETVYDWDGIKKTIGIAKWKQIVREVPDTDLLTKLIQEGNVKASDIAKFQEELPKGELHTRISHSKG